MRKIRLNIDDLAVESFKTAAAEGKTGTVKGNGWTEFEGCVVSDGASACATCDGGCPQDTSTCFASCRMTNGYRVCIDNNCY
jgi:hypothetical protein